MNMKVGAPGITPTQPEGLPPSDKDDKNFLNTFLGSSPFSTELPKPPSIDSTKASTQIATSDTVTPDAFPPHPDNKEILSRVKEQGTSLMQFAKNHPFLTAGFVLGIIFLLCAFPTIVSALAGKTGFNLFHVKVAAGLGLGVTMLYYGIYLINMARRASIKDELEAQLDSQEQIRKHALKATRESYSKDVETISQSARLTASQSKEKLEKKVLDLQSDQTQITSCIATLNQSIQSAAFQHLPKALQKSTKETLLKAEAELKNGPQALSTKEPGETLGHELTFTLPPLPKTLSLPDQPTQGQIKNQAIQRSISQKMGESLKVIPSFLKEHPGSAATITVGVFAILAALPALIFWLHGDASIYLIGSLTPVNVFQFVIIGLSLIVQGHTSVGIDNLKKELALIEKELDEHLKTYEKMNKEAQEFREKALQSLSEYQQQWQSVVYKGSPSSQTEVIKECQERIQEILVGITSLSPALLPSPTEQMNILNQPLDAVNP